MAASAVCYICLEPGDATVVRACACRQPVHRACLERWIAHSGAAACAVCRAPYRRVAPPPARRDPGREACLAVLALCNAAGVLYMVVALAHAAQDRVRCMACLVGGGALCTLMLSYIAMAFAHAREVRRSRRRVDAQRMLP